MGKQSKHDKSSLQSGKYDHKPGWFSGMLHVLDYHHWGNKHWRKHRPICLGTPRTHSSVCGSDEKQPFLDTETGDSKVLDVAERPKRQTKSKSMITRGFSRKHVKEYMDIVEILENKEIFVQILNNPDSGFRKQFQIKQKPINLTKSGSFPLPGTSRSLSLRPTTLEHKQKEHWHAPKRDSSAVTLYVPRFGVTVSSKERNPSSPSTSSSGRSDEHGFSHAVMNGFREVKKWLKNVLKDRKNKKKLPPARTHETGGLGSTEFHPVRRASSLNDSLDRYSQLIEQSFRRDAEFHSKSLKVSNEEDNGSSRSDKPKFFRRISSLSSLDSLGSFLTELSHNTTNPETGKVNFGTKKSASQKHMEHTLESRDDTNDVLERPTPSESAEDVPAAVDFPESVLLPELMEILEAEEKEEEGEEEEEKDEKERSHEDPRENIPESPNRETEQEDPYSVSRSSCSDNTVRKAETTLSDGSDPNCSDIQTHAYDSSSLGLQSKPDCQDNPEELFAELKIYNHEEEGEEDAHLCYVKNVLELSGFLTNNKDHGGQWHSEDQPLDPSLLCKLEPCLHEEDGLCNELLFDLVNEAMADTYSQSQVYFPRAFSFSRRACPMPKGKHLLDEVWGRVQWSLTSLWANKRDCSLDDLVARDLGKADGWMNVQAEAEWLALELEDMIFDDVLDDLICVCS